MRNLYALNTNVPEVPKLYDLVGKQHKETSKEARREMIYDIQRLCGDQMWSVSSLDNRWDTLSFNQPSVRNAGQHKGVVVSTETYPYYWLDS